MNAITARIRTVKQAYKVNTVWLPRVVVDCTTVELIDDRSGDVVMLTTDEACRLAGKLLEAAAKVDAHRYVRGVRR